MAPRVTQVRASPGKATEGADGGTWAAGERVRHQVGTTLSSIVWSIREQAHGSGIWRRTALARGRRPSAEPLVAGAFREQRISGGWPGGGAAQGTLQVRPCKLVGAIHGACAPAQPTRPALDRFLRAPATKDKRKIQKQKPVAALVMPDFLLLLCFPVAGQRLRVAEPGSEPVARQRDPTPCRSGSSRGSVRGGAVWACRTAGAMDGAYEPPGTGLRRVLQAHTAPPNPQQSRVAVAPAVAPAVAVAVAVAWAPLRVPGAARPKPTPRFRYNVGPVSQLRFPGHDGP